MIRQRAGKWGYVVEQLTLANPVFATYVVAAGIMLIKGVAMSWQTVLVMMRENAGFRNPEDARKTPFNPRPHDRQLEPNERVERTRRIQMNDLENLPYFFVAGLLYGATSPPLWRRPTTSWRRARGWMGRTRLHTRYRLPRTDWRPRRSVRPAVETRGR